MTDIHYMRRALALAAKGRGYTHPNPMVGAVAVQNGKVIGEGYHPKVGAAHAEVFALEQVADGTSDVTVYVTLEPCSFVGRTPACTDLLIRKGVSRVVCAMADPDVRVSGSGFKKLKAAGIAVEVGVLEKEARLLNEAYIVHRTTGLPFVMLKLAQTLDGNIATHCGDSKWITSRASRTRGHQLRAEADAILVGRGTVTADDPELSVRYVAGKSPVKIVLDSQLEVALDARVFEGETLIVATSEGVAPDRLKAREEKGAVIWQVPRINGQLDLKCVLQKAAEMGLLHVLIEGGSQVAASALAGGLVHRLCVFIAPKVLGAGLPSVGALHMKRMADAIALTDVKVEAIGEDILYTAHVKK